MATVQANLSDAERAAISRLIAALRSRFGNKLRSVWLYGSRARGEQTHTYSDVDLLVITEGGRGRDHRTVSGIAYDAASEAGADPALFSTVVMDPDRLEDRRRIKSFFIQEVDRDKIVLYGER
jgi:predicted nucleotidyltransferase